MSVKEKKISHGLLGAIFSLLEWVSSVTKEPISHALKRIVDFSFWLSVAYMAIETVPVLWERFIEYLINAPMAEKAAMAVIGVI